MLSPTKTNRFPGYPPFPEAKGIRKKENERKKHVHVLMYSQRTNAYFDHVNVMK